MQRAMRVCPEAGCPELTPGGPCAEHRRQREQRRGTRQQRGYDAAHDGLRRQWAPMVERGEVDCHEVVCLMPDRRILPGQDWHLCHDRKTGKHRGPGHARCNTSEGGRAAHGG
ncbi:hypothetical protein FHX34_103510 [Actinoplanes teichomyceticus]|uniref:HNH endonuclease n=1 Tax=Actinoplanes teichomyceticus TaxID=1867 RepID=A0A561WAU9_ACTTI|nr:hypothetical protein FHX34_103510 [Actinoplanes teichomyceticus]GIF14801.1 hypothetical protein Ate01nite_48330 [Actinoplanes teichomyceticus]